MSGITPIQGNPLDQNLPIPPKKSELHVNKLKKLNPTIKHNQTETSPIDKNRVSKISTADFKDKSLEEQINQLDKTLEELYVSLTKEDSENKNHFDVMNTIKELSDHIVILESTIELVPIEGELKSTLNDCLIIKSELTDLLDSIICIKKSKSISKNIELIEKAKNQRIKFIKEREQLNTSDIRGIDLKIRLIESVIKKMIDEKDQNQKNLIKTFIGFLPNLISGIKGCVEHFGNIVIHPILGQVLAIPGAVISIGFKALKAIEDHKALSSHTKQTADLKPFQLPNVINGGNEKENEKVIYDHLKKRELVRSEKFENAKLLLDNLIKKHGENFSAFSKDATNLGFRINSDSINNMENITNEIKNDLVNAYVEKQETLSTIGKDLLKERLKAHEAINNKFFSFKSKKSEVLFIVGAIITVATIALTIVSAAGVFVFPPALLIIPGILMTVGAIAAGLYHLHQNKPNLFKELIKGYADLVPLKIKFNETVVKIAETVIKLKTLLNEISLKISKLGIEFAKWRSHENSEEVKKLEEKYFQRKQNKIFKASITEWEEIGKEYKQRVFNLLEPIRKARIHDYEEKTDFKMTDFEEISRALVEGDYLKDESRNLIHKYLGIELGEEANLNPERREQDIKFINDKIESVITRKSQDIYEWVNLQNRDQIKI